MINIYYYRIDKDIDLKDCCYLSKTRKAKLKSITNKKVKELSTYLELILQYGMYQNSYDIPFEYYYDNNGKPRSDDIYFNLSDSDSMVIVAISDSEVGIDLEKKDRKVAILKNKVLSVKELDEYDSKVDLNSYILDKFVRKESYLKLIGSGIFKTSLNKVSINNIDGLYQTKIDLGDYFSVISSNNKDKINVKEIKEEDLDYFLKGIKNEKL